MSSNVKRKDFINSVLVVLLGFFIIFAINSIICLFDKENNFNIFNKIFLYDAYWYESIIKQGYKPTQSYVIGMANGMTNWAFFPLLPYTIKLLNIITFGVISIPVLGSIFSFVCYIFFIYNIIQYLREKEIKISYPILFIIFILNSITIFLYTLYTEAIAMLLVILLIRACDKKKYLLGGLICSLLTFTKVQGCIWCIYLFIKIYQECYTKKDNWLKTFISTILNIIKNPKHLFSLVVSPLGLFAFMIILSVSDLSPFAFIHVQKAWNKKNGFFLLVIIKAIMNKNLNGCIALFFVLFILYLYKKKKYLNASVLLLYIVIACSSSVASISRYMVSSVIFPLEVYLIVLEDFNKFIASYKTKNVDIFLLLRMSIFMLAKVVVIALMINFIITNRTPLY